MSRIKKAFEDGKTKGEKLFIAYICALDPNFEVSLEACRTLIESGVDIIELGVPFSDPLADGKTNQLAAERALEAGGTPDQVLDLVKKVREFSQTPIVIYTYYNLIFTKGVKEYAHKAAEAGIDGLLVLDLPPEESGEMDAACKETGLDRIFLIAPTTPEERIPRITQNASGFIYYVSREGVTGERSDVASNLKSKVDLIRKHTDLPIAVGFGISNADQVKQVAEHSDGVIVGSSIVNLFAKHETNTSELLPALSSKIKSLREGL